MTANVADGRTHTKSVFMNEYWHVYIGISSILIELPQNHSSRTP